MLRAARKICDRDKLRRQAFIMSKDTYLPWWLLAELGKRRDGQLNHSIKTKCNA